MKVLRNLINKEELKAKLERDNEKRVTLSFYRYVRIEEPENLRDQLFLEWRELGVFGRIYLAKEGINAQLSVPERNFEKFRENLYADSRFADVPFKIAVEDDGKSFYKLAIKVRTKIVADGLPDEEIDFSNVGKHLNAEEFNEEMEKGAVVVDMRNQYESEIGRFENAICPDADTFREELPMVLDLLADKKDKKVLLYCTGGVRCEKASAFLRHHGFEDVNQLYGGVIEYAKEVRAKGLKSKFKGKNFVFDERKAERITEDVLSNCHQCGEPADTHTNCANDACHLLFIQCSACAEKFSGCCTPKCREITSLPIEQQRELRKGEEKEDAISVYKSRLRPKLPDLCS